MCGILPRISGRSVPGMQQSAGSGDSRARVNLPPCNPRMRPSEWTAGFPPPTKSYSVRRGGRLPRRAAPTRIPPTFPWTNSNVSCACGETRSLMLRLFVTGTDTGVGKTRIAAALCAAYAARDKRVAGMKPVASGCRQTAAGLRNEDAEALLTAMTVRAAYVDVNPYAFEPAIAPHIAAMEAGCSIDFDVLDRCYERLCRNSDVIIVEGAGGWLAPLDATHTFADLAVRWQLDVILVVG